MAFDSHLDGRIAFVTGSTRGIGWAAARALAEQGASVVVNGRGNPALLNDRVDWLKKTYDRPFSGILCDLSQPADIERAYGELFKQYKRLDILVNNAGIMHYGLLGMISAAAIQETFQINAHALILNMQSAARIMKRTKGGSIINLTSIVGRVGNEGQTVYAASKAAVIGATLSAAKELAPSQIRVNAVAPGFINTDMMREIPEEKYKQRLESIKMGRVGEPEDVAGTILFLACDLSRYVTGQVIGVDGGMLI